VTDKILRKPKVLKTIGVSDSTLWRWEKDGKFPKRVQLGGNSTGWFESEINGWLAMKAAEREV